MVNGKRALPFLTLAAALYLAAACSRGADEVRTVTRERAAGRPIPPAVGSPAPTAAAQAEQRKSYEPLVKFDGEFGFETEEIKERDEKRKYEISFTYPRLRGPRGPRVAGFNKAAAALARGETGDFRHASLGPPERERPPHFENVFDTLEATHEEIYATDQVVSIRFTAYAYGWGAAHSAQYFRVLNYDLTSDRRLRLRDLFRPGAKHLKLIADFCTTALREQATADCRETNGGRDCERAGDFFSPERLSPKPKNYEDWNLTKAGLLISFPACHVDACAGGEKEILIPYAILKDVLAPRGVAAEIVTEQNEGRNTGRPS